MTISTIVNNGSSDNRIDIVFLGDGYTASEISTTYQTHISNMTDYLFTANSLVDPFYRYQKFFNVHYVAVVSQESGTDDPNAGIFKDTALHSTYLFDGVTDRLLSVDQAVTDVVLADALSGTGVDAEMKFVTVNSSKYGGAGGSYAVYAGANSFALELGLHEIGHSFANLADEYSYPGAYTGGEPAAINITTDDTGSKWSRWLGFQDPNLGVVGAYEGGFYAETGIYRPTADSKMRSLNRAFDPIAKEAFVLEFYKYVDPLDTYSFQSESPNVTNPGTLSVNPIDVNIIDLEWKVDGQVVGGDQTSFDTSSLSTGTYTVTVRAYDNTALSAITLMRSSK